MIRVVKVGGSLFELSDLPVRIQRWLARQTPAHHVLVAGGGSVVNQIRRAHAVEPMDEIAAHWRCIDLLTETAQALHGQLPEFPHTDDLGMLARVVDPGVTIFGPAAWLRSAEAIHAGMPLTCGWETTSDAIAGRLAVVLRADELVLLKSTLPDRQSSTDLASLAAAGYIDQMLAHLTPELPPIRCVDFRAHRPREIRFY
jgi:aspartokinase-like uncharacterized kinase